MITEKKPFNLKNLYLYLSSFVALIFFLFGAIITASNLADIFFGESYYQSYNQFYQDYIHNNFADKKEVDPSLIATETPSSISIDDEAKIRALYEEEKAFSQENTRRRNLRDLIGSLTTFVLGLFFWLFFWHQAKKR